MNHPQVIALFVTFLFLGAAPVTAATSDRISNTKESSHLSNEELLTKLQRQTIDYFWTGAEPVSGLARERLHMDGVYPQNDQDVVTSGGSGFGLMAVLVGVERGFIPRSKALAQFEKNLTFLETADRFHGVWPHWWIGPTGKTKPFSKKDDGGDLVETAFLVQGLLTVRQYFHEGTPRERAIAQRCDQLWKEVDWTWYTRGNQDALYWHWSPNFGWDMNFRIGGYNECLIVYLLAAASPTHGTPASVYHKGWARGGDIRSDRKCYNTSVILDHYEHDEACVGPLFWAHYSYLGLNPKGLSDTYADYWQLNQNHALIHYAHCVDNPNEYKGYGPDLWGLTSSYSMRGYAGHRPDKDLGVISPTAALASFPYTPTQSMAFLRSLYEKHSKFIGKYGPYDAFSLEHEWHLKRYLAIDQGPIPVMIENHRSGLIWKLFMSAPEIQSGLKKLGFESKQ
jgi:hypothetical protein